MIGAYEFHGVIDVLDDGFPAYAREFSGIYGFADQVIAFAELAIFIFAAALLDFGLHLFVEIGIGLGGVAVFLAEETDVVIDLDYAAFGGQGFDHLVGHVAGMIAEGAAGGMRGDHGGLADG